MKSLGVKKFHSLLLVSSISIVLNIIALLSDTVVAAYLDVVENEGALAAITIAAPIISIMSCVSSMLSFGVEFFYNKALGEENKKHAYEIFGMGLITSIFTGIAIFIIAKYGINLYLNFLNPDDEVKFHFHEYFRYFQFVLLITPLSDFLNDMVYNDGDEITANCSNLMNIFGNIILSVMFAFYFEMEMSGIALGTLLKEIFSILILLCHFFRKTNSIHLRIYFKFKQLLQFFKYGFVNSGMFLSLGILAFMMNKIVIAFYGSFYLSVLTIAFSLIEIAMVLDGVSMAMFPVMDVYYNEGNSPAVRKIIKSALKISIFEGIIFSIILFVFAEEIAVAFDIDNPELLKHSANAIKIISSTMIFLSLKYFFDTYYTIVGKIFISLMINSIGDLIFVPLISFSLLFSENINGIWIGFALSPVFTLILCVLILKIFYKDGNFPFYLNDEKNVADFDLELSPENIRGVMDKAEKFLLDNGFSKKIINKILFTIEEAGMLIYEKNRGKKILAEYTLFLEPERVKIIISDNGKVFDITNEDTEIKSFGSYIFSLVVPKVSHQKKYLTATSLNKNIFYIDRN